MFNIVKWSPNSLVIFPKSTGSFVLLKDYPTNRHFDVYNKESENFFFLTKGKFYNPKLCVPSNHVDSILTNKNTNSGESVSPNRARKKLEPPQEAP